MLALSTPGNISGNKLRMSMRIGCADRFSGSALARVGRRRDLLPRLRINVDALEQVRHRFARLRANAQPVVDAIDFQVELFVFRRDRIKPAQLFNDAAIARSALVNGVETIKRAMSAAHALQ